MFGCLFYLFSSVIETASHWCIVAWQTDLETKSATLNSRNLLFTLISRRSRHRAGTRYFSRGINSEGQVSNYNETEQIVLLDHSNNTNSEEGEVKGEIRFSYVQTRGSVPVYWAEINNLRYKPDLRIMDINATVRFISFLSVLLWTPYW